MRQCLILSILFLSFTASLFSQDKERTWDFNQTPLPTVFKTLESEYNIRFSYTSNTLKEYTLSYQGNANLEELFTIIESQYPINFNKIDGSNYTVTSQGVTKNACGIIKDFQTNAPLEGVSIFSIQSEKGTTTDALGRFELQGIAIDDTLLIQSLGFEDKEILVSNFNPRNCIEIKLEQSVMALDAIVLKEFLTTGFDRNTSDGSLTVTPEKLGILPGLTEPDVLQSLQLIPGISSPNETASGLFVRGGTPDQNLVLWDGIKMYHQGHFFGQISAFNPYITKKIDIYQSGTSAIYGDRISSVINIETLNKTPQKLKAGAGFNFTQADAFVEIPISEHWGAIVGARNSYSDLYETITFTKISEKVFQNTKISETGVEEDDFEILSNSFQFRDINAKVLYHDENQNFSISALFLDNTLDFSARNDFIISSDNLAVTNNGVSVQWDRQLTQKWNFKFQGYYSDYDSNFFFNENETTDASNIEVRKENTVTDLGASLHSIFSFNTNHSLLSGYEFSTNQVTYLIEEIEDGTTAISQNSDDRLNSHSLFSEYLFNKNRWLLRGGFRVNYLNNEQAWYFEPRVFLKYKLNKYLSFQTSGEIKNQSISQLVDFEFNEIGVGENIWVLTDDDDVSVLNNQQITLGTTFEKSGWSIDIEGYYRKITGISSLSQSFETMNTENLDIFQNIDANVLGIDLLVKKRFKNLRSWISYTFNNTDYSFEDIEGSFPGTFEQPHNLTLANTYTFGKFQASLGWTFTSGRPFSQPTEIVETLDENGDTDLRLNFPGLNQQRLKSYHRLDASLFYEYSFGRDQTRKIRLGISLFNIYNQRNELEKSFRIDENEDTGENPEIVERIQFGQGFTPNVVCRVFF